MQQSLKKLIVVTAIAFLAWLALIIGGVAFIGKGLASARTQYDNFHLQISEFEEKNIQFGQALISYQKATKDIGRVNKSFVQNNDILDVLVQLESEAEKTNNAYGVEVNQDIPAPAKAKTEDTGSSASTTPKVAQALPGTVLRISLAGTFANIFQFIYDAQRLPYFVQIQKVNIRRQPIEGIIQVLPTTASDQIIHAFVVIKVYSQPAQ